jgi:error-prone DNA polymerase
MRLLPEVPPPHPYTELKAASYFSFLRGGSSPQEMLEAAFALGLNGLALTDIGGVYGAPRAYHALKELRKTEPRAENFKLILGAEILLRDGALPSITCIAPTRIAYGSLCKMLTKSHENRPKGTGDLSFAELLLHLKDIPGAEGLFLFPEWEELWLNDRENFVSSGVHAQFAELKKFKNSIYLPITRFRDGLDQARVKTMRELSKEFHWKCTARQNALYHEPARQIVQDVLTSIRETIPLKDLGIKLKRNSEQRLKGVEEMNDLFSDFPEAIHTTQEIFEQCSFEMSELKYIYPTEWIPKGFTSLGYLKKLCEEGILIRYAKRGGETSAIRNLLNKELELIEELNFADYFLTVYDIVAFARSQKILCQGRGSAANSIVCYLLGITALDPVEMDFLFERFISTERGEPPDIDIDFEHDRREEVIQYIYKKYGRHRAAMVSAVVTYGERSALREVAKAFSFPVGTASAREVKKMIVASETFPDIVKEKIAEVCKRIESYPRHLSIHSGGFTLSHEPIDTMVPIEPATMEGRTIIQWDKFDLDVLGLLKIDILALGMLSVLRRALDKTGHELYEIPQNDKPTYDMMCRAETIGVFQIESRAQMAMLPRLKPQKFYDLVVEIALVRPGPIVGNMVHPYLKRKQGIEKVVYPNENPKLKEILERTYGVPIFQEQVMKMAVAVGGFSPGESDRLRRAIGAWRSSGAIDEMGARLRKGLVEVGKLPEAFAQQIFDQIQGFSEYGFPESHSASFSLLAYASAYLKRHHPAVFLYALLNSQPMGFYSPHSLVDDAKRNGVRVLPICVNTSGLECELLTDSDGKQNTVRMGLSYVSALQKKEAEALLIARAERPFLNFQDFLVRTQLSGRSLKALALASAFEGMGLNSREALFEILSLQEGLFRQAEVQGDLFQKVNLPKLLPQEQVTQDYQSTGMSVRAHPMKFLRDYLNQTPRYRSQHNLLKLNNQTLKRNAKNGQFAKILGLSVVLQRPPTAKGTAFATLEDESGLLDLIFHKQFYDQYKEQIREEVFLWVSGIVQKDGDAFQLVVKRIDRVFEEASVFDDFAIPVAPGAHQKHNMLR